MTFFIKRPFRLSISLGLDDTDDEKTPEYPLRDDHPLSLHNRALLFKTCTAASSECDTVIRLSSQGSTKPSTQANNINSSTIDEPEFLKQSVPISNNRLDCQDKQKSSSIQNEKQERVHNERYKNHMKSMLRSVIEGLDLASEFKWTENHDLKENFSLLVRSLLDCRVENVESMTAARNGFIIKKLMSHCKRSTQQSRVTDNLIDTNNNSGRLSSYQIQIENNAPHCTHSVEKFASYFTSCNPTLPPEHSTGMTATGLCKQVDHLDISENQSKIDVSFDIGPDIEEKNVPPQLSPVVNISPKSEIAVNTQGHSFPPILWPMKIETSFRSPYSENLSVNASEGTLLSPVNLSTKAPASRTTDSSTVTGHNSQYCLEKLSAECQFSQANNQDAQLQISTSDHPLDTAKRAEEEIKCTKTKVHPSKKDNKEYLGMESKQKELTVLNQESSMDEFGDRCNKSRDNLLHTDFSCRRELNKPHFPSRTRKTKPVKTTPVPKSGSGTVFKISSETTIRNQMHLSTDSKTVTSGKSYLCYPYSVQAISVNNKSDKNVQECEVNKFKVDPKNVSSGDIAKWDVSHVTAKAQNIKTSSHNSTQKSFGMTMSSLRKSNISSQQEIISMSSNSFSSPSIPFSLHSLRHDSFTHPPQFASSMASMPLSLVSAPEKTLMQTTTYNMSHFTAVTTTIKYPVSVDLGVSLPHKPILPVVVKKDTKLLENQVDVKNISQRPPETHTIASSLAQETRLSTTDPSSAKLYDKTNDTHSLELHNLPSQIKVEGSCEMTVNSSITISSAKENSFQISKMQDRSSMKLKSPVGTVSGENSLSDVQTTRVPSEKKGVLNLKKEKIKNVNGFGCVHTNLQSSPSSSASGNGQSEPLDLSGKHCISPQKTIDERLSSDVMTELGNGSHHLNGRKCSVDVASKEVLDSNEFELHNVRASFSGDGRKCDDLLRKTCTGNNNIPYSAASIYRLHEMNSEKEYLKSYPEHRGRPTQTIQRQDNMKELSLLHEPNLVVDIEDNDWETSLMRSNNEKLKTREFPVKNYFSSHPDENSYSYLAYAAITSKRKKVSCNIPTENEDFLGFLRRSEGTSGRKVKSIHSSSVDSVTSRTRKREVIDLTEENEDILSISSDETIEDMNIVFDPGFMLKSNGTKQSPEDKTCEINSVSPIESCYIHDGHANRTSTEFRNNDLNNTNVANISGERDSGSEIMLFPIHEGNIKNSNFKEPYKFELDQQINPACQEQSSILDSSKLSHIKEQTLTFSGPQKALMARKIQDIISRNSRLLPEDMRPSATLLPFTQTSSLTKDLRAHMPPTSDQRMTPSFKLPTEESQSRVEYHDTHPNVPEQLAEDAIPISSYKFGRAFSSESVPIGSIQHPVSNIDIHSNLINSQRVPINDELYLDTSYGGIVPGSQFQIPRNDETPVESDIPYKTVWQTHFITKKEKNNPLEKSVVCSNPEDQDIVQRLQLMHNATNKLNQASHSVINQGSLTDSDNVNNKRRRSFAKRGNQVLRDNTFSDPESVSYLPDHIPSPLPSTTRQLNPFIPSPFVVAPYYAMAYPLCYPTFQGSNTSNQPILLSPHTATMDSVENRYRRSNGRKRTRREKPPSESPVRKRRSRNVRKNKGCVRENVGEKFSNEIIQNSPSALLENSTIYKCQDTEKNVNDNSQNCETMPRSTSINSRNTMGFIDSNSPTPNEGNIQELLGSESDHCSFLLQTRNEDGLTILSMQDTRKSVSNDTKTKCSNSGVEDRPLFKDSYRVDLDLLHSYPATANMEFPVISQRSNDDLLSSSVQDSSVTETLDQNLDTLALASEKHEQMAKLGFPPSASCRNGYSDTVRSNINGNEGFLISGLNRSLDEVCSFQSDNDRIQIQRLDSLSQNEDESPKGESQKVMHGIAEKEKLVTEMLAAMMHNRNLSAGDKID